MEYKTTMLYSTMLYSTMLYSTMLYSTMLYSTMLYSTMLYSTMPKYIISAKHQSWGPLYMLVIATANFNAKLSFLNTSSLKFVFILIVLFH